MGKFLFWNLKRQPLQKRIARLALMHRVDVLIFAECVIPPEELLVELNSREVAEYQLVRETICHKITLFTKFSSQFITPVFEDECMTIRHLRLPGQIDILLSAIHFPSKNYCDDTSQMGESFQLSNSIRRTEERIGHSRTVLVGDLNMNPFEDGMIMASGLHAVACRRIAQKGSRIVNGRAYPFFYNPMWNCFGDEEYPPGTYHYSNAEQRTYFWNIFDQVLIRPALLERFHPKSVNILSSDGERSLLTPSGTPDKKTASDHLPILFELHL